MEPPYDIATAYHEAGHAVMALIHKRPVQRVSVLANQHHLGVCLFGKAVIRPSKDWLESEILISLAGLAAEAIHTGNYAWAGAGRDLRHVHDLAVQRAGERQAERYEKRMLAKAEYLLQDEGHWRAVELIVAELLRVGVISGRAVRHLFQQGCDAC